MMKCYYCEKEIKNTEQFVTSGFGEKAHEDCLIECDEYFEPPIIKCDGCNKDVQDSRYWFDCPEEYVSIVEIDNESLCLDCIQKKITDIINDLYMNDLEKIYELIKEYE